MNGQLMQKILDVLAHAFQLKRFPFLSIHGAALQILVVWCFVE